jgi:galactokinase
MLFRAPGRVNLIGEHTDYNSGFVLPVAIQLNTYARVTPRNGRSVVVSSHGVGDFDFNLDDPSPRPGAMWSDYIRGIAFALDRRFDHALRGTTLEISSDIPIGAGLSSSAAIEVACALALLSNSGLVLAPLDLALLCQRAENEFVGARCGIMDQFASTHGRAGHAILLDCRSLDVTYVPIPDHVTLVVCNTMTRHALASNEYNLRRAQCEEASRVLGKSLRDATLEDLAGHNLDSTIERRARHVISENQRVLDAVDALRSSDVHRFGELMLQSHRSLRDDYEVSCVELDTMVSLALNLPDVLGARLTGGGFGGCTVNLVESSQAINFADQIAKSYQRETGIQPDIYICEASNGAGPA